MALEAHRPGFAERLIVTRSPSRCAVDFATGVVTAPVPALSPRRSRTLAGELSSATLIEAAAEELLGQRFEHHLPSLGFRLLLGFPGTALPALPGAAGLALRAAAAAAARGRPVVAASLPRSGPVVLHRDLPEHLTGGRATVITPNHVYAVLGAGRRRPDGTPDSRAPLRLRLRNPVVRSRGDVRSVDVHLSAGELTRAGMTLFIA